MGHYFFTMFVFSILSCTSLFFIFCILLNFNKKKDAKVSFKTIIFSSYLVTGICCNLHPAF
jgi:hypothetical protein